MNLKRPAELFHFISVVALLGWIIQSDYSWLKRGVLVAVIVLVNSILHALVHRPKTPR